MKIGIAIAAVLVLSGCGSRESQSLRSLVDDGKLPLLPVAADETIAIGLNFPKRPTESLIITIQPDGTVTYDWGKGTPPESQPTLQRLAVRHVSKTRLSELRMALSVFRPPDSMTGSILPLGCKRHLHGNDSDALVFAMPKQMPRFFHFQAACKTEASRKLQQHLNSVLDSLPLKPRDTGALANP